MKSPRRLKQKWHRHPGFQWHSRFVGSLRPAWNLQAYIDAASYAVPYPVSKNTTAWEDRQNEVLLPGFSGKKSIEEVANEFATLHNEALAKEQ